MGRLESLRPFPAECFSDEIYPRSQFLAVGRYGKLFFTGLHPDYHTPRDTPSKINYPKLEKITKLVYLSALKIANNSARPKYVDAASLPTPK